MNNTGVLLRRPHVASILEGDPGVTGFKEHGEHFSPKIRRLNGLAGRDLASFGLFFIDHIGLFKGLTKVPCSIGLKLSGTNGLASQ